MKMLRLLLLSFIILTTSGVVQARGIAEGSEYERVSPPLPTQVSGNKIEVVEMFWYGCPHCFQFEPKVQNWLKKKPANVEFIRIPATFNPIWKLHARMFYTAEVLGVGEKLHKLTFDAYHIKRQRLRTEAEIRQHFVKHGVKGEDFDDAFRSFAVEVKLNRAIELTRNSGITGVPAMIVNGKYRTKNSANASTLDIVDFLIKKEKK